MTKKRRTAPNTLPPLQLAFQKTKKKGFEHPFPTMHFDRHPFLTFPYQRIPKLNVIPDDFSEVRVSRGRPVQDEVPKSRITLTYVNEVQGEPASIDLPFRLLIPGDFSGGTSKDRKEDLDKRKARSIDGSNTSDLMKEMDISINMVVSNKVSPETEESISVNLQVDEIDSFSPESLAKQVPQVRALLLLKKLLEEMQSNIANKKEFANLLNKLYADQKDLDKIKEELKNYSPVLPKPTTTKDRLFHALEKAKISCSLSNREAECTALSVSGFSAKQIAIFLSTSFRTVQKQLEHAYAKLGSYGKSHCMEMMYINGTLTFWQDFARELIENKESLFK